MSEGSPSPAVRACEVCSIGPVEEILSTEIAKLSAVVDFIASQAVRGDADLEPDLLVFVLDRIRRRIRAALVLRAAPHTANPDRWLAAADAGLNGDLQILKGKSHD